MIRNSYLCISFDLREFFILKLIRSTFFPLNICFHFQDKVDEYVQLARKKVGSLIEQ